VISAVPNVASANSRHFSFPSGLKLSPLTNNTTLSHSEASSTHSLASLETTIMGDIPYHPLDAEKKEIRLLTIQPGEWDDVVRCRLDTVSLDEKPVYEALSYVWGGSVDEPAERAGIIVDAVGTMVTVNLQRALRRLRDAKSDRVMWVDALCINQGDAAERGHQVGKMNAVFSSCSRCMIWLGEEADYPLAPYLLPKIRRKSNAAFKKYIESQGKTSINPIHRSVSLDVGSHCDSWLDVETGFDLARMLGEDKHLYEMPFYRITEFPEYEFCKNWVNAWYSLVNILGERPWWRRTWTVQEAVLPELATLQLGKHQVGLNTLLCAASNYSKHSLGCCRKPYGQIWEPLPISSGRSFLLDAFSLVDDLHHLRSFRAGKETKSLEFQLVVYCQLAQRRSTTDPRDSVYGIFGMFPAILSPNDSPDYNKNIATVYSEASLRSIQILGSLDFFKYCSQERNRKHLHLPSWVLDWGTDEDDQFPSRYYGARESFTTYAPIAVLSKDLTLPVHSRKIAAVQQIGKTFEGNQLNPRIIIDWKSMTPLADDAFWRTVFQDTNIVKPEESSMSEDDFRIVKDWWQWFQAMEADELGNGFQDILLGHTSKKDFEACNQFLQFSYLRESVRVTYFVSDLGHPGITRVGVEVGDQIHIAKGGLWPIILRPLTETIEGVSDELRLDLYSLVSCCYLDGFMSGEAAVEGDVDWQTVYLR
jgi:hypothetical protein